MVPESGTMLDPKEKAMRRMVLTYTWLIVEWEKEG